jgi:glycosyltransferase involved in cell wall biosynthesis
LRRFDFPESEKLQMVEKKSAEDGRTGRMRWLLHGQAAAARALRLDALISMGGIAVGRSAAIKVVFIQQSLPFCAEALSRCGRGTDIRMAVMRRLMKASCSDADLIVAQTPTMATWVAEGLGLQRKRVQVVLPWVNGIGLDEEQDGSADAMLSVPRGKRLLYVGNASPYKNLKCLIDALPAIRRHVPGATLFMTCAADLPLCQAEGVVALGYLGGKSLRAAYGHATLFITASLVESGNVVLTEAMSLGTPIIAAARPYARDLCGAAATYFDPYNPEALAACAIDLLKDEEKRRTQARLGTEMAARYRNSRPSDGLIETVLMMAGNNGQYKSV